MEHKASLSEVEDCLRNRAWRGTFPDRLETLYDYHMRSIRERSFDKLVLPILIIYNLFLIADIFLLPDTWRLSLFLHLGVVGPAVVVIWLVYRRIRSNLARAIAEASIPFMMVVQIMTIYALNTGEADGHYQYFAVMVVVFANVNIRLQHKYARWLTPLIVGVYASVMWSGQAGVSLKVAATFTMVGVAYSTLMANRRFEWDARYTFLRQLQDSLRYAHAEAEAMNDPLTGLRNRRYLEEFKLRTLPEVFGGRSQTAAIMIDIDHFKDYNDAYGHQAGDECLKKVAGAIAASTRNNDDIAVRYGGEEFLIVLPGAGIEQGVRTARRIRAAVAALNLPHEHSSAADHVTVSLGVFAGPSSPEVFPTLIAGADAALYVAKNEGRNRVCRSDDTITKVNVA